MAERLSRTLKEEFNLGNDFVSEEAVLKAIPQVIETYNNYRSHASLNFNKHTQCRNSGRNKKLR